MSGQVDFDPSVTTCANCRTSMPVGLRFCRNCGFRLGEGPAEYTETVRFQDGQAGRGAAFGTNYAAPLAQTPAGAVGKRKRMSGMSWMFIGLLVFFLAAAAFTAIVTPIRRGVGGPTISVPAKPRVYFGVNEFQTADGDTGVTFGSVEPPGSPADKAGLVGGDIITSFDGHPVKEEDQLTELLQAATVGKAVDVIYLRDGEEKTTKVTPVSDDEFQRLQREFSNRPKGRFGFDDDNTERVPIPGTKIFGVRLDDISQNFPADIAGVKEGDIVTEFDGVPIRTPEEMSARVRRAVPYSTIKVVVMRGTEMIEIPVKMGKQ